MYIRGFFSKERIFFASFFFEAIQFPRGDVLLYLSHKAANPDTICNKLIFVTNPLVFSMIYFCDSLHVEICQIYPYRVIIRFGICLIKLNLIIQPFNVRSNVPIPLISQMSMWQFTKKPYPSELL